MTERDWGEGACFGGDVSANRLLCSLAVGRACGACAGVGRAGGRAEGRGQGSGRAEGKRRV